MLAAAAAGGGVPPSEWLYIIAAVLTIAVSGLALRSGWRKYIGQRQDEAVKNAELQKAITGNADATRENTAALTRMSQDFHDFALETRSALNGHAERIGKLEHPQT